jgi:hypothetical protein
MGTQPQLPLSDPTVDTTYDEDILVTDLDEIISDFHPSPPFMPAFTTEAA